MSQRLLICVNSAFALLKKVPAGTLAVLLWIVTDTRSALVGGAAASIVSLVFAYFHDDRPRREVEVFVGDSGYAMPMSALLDAVEQDDKKTTFVFEPPDLEKVYVCEYAHLAGYTGRNIMLDYLTKYSACFSVSQIDSDKYRIRTSRNSPEIKKIATGWYCSCN